MKTLRVFIGFDPRQPVAYNVAAYSAAINCSKPVSITPLMLPQLQVKRRGLTEFTFSRYLVPWLCDYEGHALFMDSDVLVRGDISLLPWDHSAAVAMVPHKASALHPEQNLAFERASVMLFNNAQCRMLGPEYVENGHPQKFEWIPRDTYYPLEAAWNHLVGYDKPNSAAKIAHFTMGIPLFDETVKDEFCDEYHRIVSEMNGSVPWRELMGNSVHARHKAPKPSIMDGIGSQVI